jgi:hypothetical protein
MNQIRVLLATKTASALKLSICPYHTLTLQNTWTWGYSENVIQPDMSSKEWSQDTDVNFMKCGIFYKA